MVSRNNYIYTYNCLCVKPTDGLKLRALDGWVEDAGVGGGDGAREGESVSGTNSIVSSL